jgi:hypothetical protein
MSIVESLMYTAFGSWPDITFSVTALSRYNVQPFEMHTIAAKRVLRYLKTTLEFRIYYQRLPHSANSITIIGYTNSDQWAGNVTTRKSASWRICVRPWIYQF